MFARVFAYVSCENIVRNMRTKKLRTVSPSDWVMGRPYETADAVDRYYAGLATKVMNMLRRSCISDAFQEDVDLCESAKCLTGWFEDLCSDTGIWHVANEEYRRRYGAVLPFYDVTDYYEGEPNVQDLQLLLWHLVQTFRGAEEGCLINPENPGIAMVAADLCRLFEGEYETAPVNTRLYDFIHDPGLSTDWWACRNLMHWFALSSFINPCKLSLLEDEVFDHLEDAEEDSSKWAAPFFYELTLKSCFADRDNLLSMTVPQWCGRVTGVNDLLSCRRQAPSVYCYMGRDDSQFTLRDECDGTLYKVENDSLEDQSVLDDLVKGVSKVYVSLSTFGKRLYLCGTMLPADEDKEGEKLMEGIRMSRKAKAEAPKLKSRFLEASKGASMLFFKDMDETRRYLEKTMHLGADILRSEDMGDDMKGCVTLMCDDERGLMLMGGMTRCIAAPDNPYYDKTFAEKNAINLFVNNDVVSYGMACDLIDKGYLPDAVMNSVEGTDYGRAFLQQHGQFFLDYFHQRYQGDSL